jgi:hypothetical protein
VWRGWPEGDYASSALDMAESVVVSAAGAKAGRAMRASIEVMFASWFVVLLLADMLEVPRGCQEAIGWEMGSQKSVGVWVNCKIDDVNRELRGGVRRLVVEEEQSVRKKKLYICGPAE